jgi:hypothetical protein
MLQQSGWSVYLSLWFSDCDNFRPDLRPGFSSFNTSEECAKWP